MALISTVLAGGGTSILHTLGSLRFYLGEGNIKLTTHDKTPGSIQSRYSASFPYVYLAYSVDDEGQPVVAFGSILGVAPRRDRANIVLIHDDGGTFMLCRTLVMGHCSLKTEELTPKFSIIVVDDGGVVNGRCPEQYTSWEDHGFVVMGPNAGHHFLQFVLYTTLLQWEISMKRTLDILDSKFKTTVSPPRIRRRNVY